MSSPSWCQITGGRAPDPRDGRGSTKVCQKSPESTIKETYVTSKETYSRFDCSQGQDWWKHARDICDPSRSDLLTHPSADLFKDIPWDYLATFEPIDLRGESLNEEGSLQDDSAAEHEIIRRVMSRFFR